MEDYQYYMQYAPRMAAMSSKVLLGGGDGQLHSKPDWYQSNPFAITKIVLKHANEPQPDPMSTRAKQLGMKVLMYTGPMPGGRRQAGEMHACRARRVLCMPGETCVWHSPCLMMQGWVACSVAHHREAWVACSVAA